MANEPAPAGDKQHGAQRVRYDQYKDGRARGAEPEPAGGTRGNSNVVIAILVLVLAAVIVVGMVLVVGLVLILRPPSALTGPSASATSTAGTPTTTAPETTATAGTVVTSTTTTTAAPVPTQTPEQTEEDRVRAAQAAARELARRAKQAKALAQKNECDRFKKSPNAFLASSGTTYYDRGIVRSYRQLSSITVLNHSRYCVADGVRGTVDWFDANGSSLGTTNFSLALRPINAGSAATFSTADGSLTSGTIAGAGASGNVTFTSALVGYMCLPPDNDCPKGEFCTQGYCADEP